MKSLLIILVISWLVCSEGHHHYLAASKDWVESVGSYFAQNVYFANSSLIV